MDPNETLSQIRQILAHDRDAARLADLVEALDGWLTEGGFMPQAWASTRPPGVSVIRLLEVARDLNGDEPHSNTEYLRGMVELIRDALHVGGEASRELVEAAILVDRG